ncbi:MAG TPA: lysophospholipid acyltransferase family protein [Gemmatimonadaceae bacterium]|nr:lysophospholipid acyltransferase family protein [Gemmatimonadaceae bacterium]
MTSARLPVIGPATPRAGGAVSSALGHVALTLLRWRVDGEVPDIPKMVMIAAPHSSNWDFIVGVAAKLGMRLRVKFLAKDSLFRFPLGFLMRGLGGIPIDRSASNAVVTSTITEFQRRAQLILVIAPEGTRKQVSRWRTGFYHIAHGAGVPIVTAAFNWGERAIQIGAPFYTTGDVEADLRALQERFSGVARRDASP